jgi:Tol biopolymer transport system component
MRKNTAPFVGFLFILLAMGLTACSTQVDTTDLVALTPTELLSATSTGVPTLLPTLMGGSDQILFSSNRGGAYDDLYLLDLTSSQVTRLTQGDSNTFPGPFSPDGSQILFTGFGLATSYVGLMSADGTNPLDLTQAEVDEGFATWSPDGKTIAFTSRRDGNNEIYVMKSDGSEPKRLTNNPTDDFAPAWSPDGSQIAFVSDRDNATGVNNLYIMNTDGSHVRRLTKGSEIDYSPAWSPDGAWIAFRAHHDGPADIYLIKPDGTGLVNLTNNPTEDWAATWSPDGTLLAFQTDRDGNWEIYVIHADGSNPLNLTQNPADDQMPYWAPSTGMANPASENCVQQGGMLVIEKRGEMGEFGVCYFEDNLQCEEWALLRGECPTGGLKVTGYITEAARFCAITGGEYAITGNSGADNEQGTCTFKTGKSCDVWDYYNGKCGPNE